MGKILFNFAVKAILGFRIKPCKSYNIQMHFMHFRKKNLFLNYIQNIYNLDLRTTLKKLFSNLVFIINAYIRSYIKTITKYTITKFTWLITQLMNFRQQIEEIHFD